MTKYDMWERTFSDKSKIIKENPNSLEELYKELNWKETYRIYVVLNWFRTHDKHRFLQYRSFIFFAGDIRQTYDVILTRYKREMKARGKRV